MSLKDYTSAAKNAILHPKLAAKNLYARATDSGIRYALMPQHVYAADNSTESGMSTATTGYKKKADGGYDYVINGNPASLQDYIAAFGIENVPQDEPALAQMTTNPVTDAGTSGTGGTSGGGSGTIQSNKIVGPDGGIYDIATPDGAAAYKIAKDNWVNDQYNKYTGDFSTDLKRSKEDNATQKLALARSKKNFYGDVSQGGNDIGSYARDINALGTNRDAAQQSVMGKFLSLGPNVYQSAEGENLKEVGNIYDQGVTQANNEKADTEANFNTADQAIQRTAEDLAKQEVEQPKYFDTWKQQNLSQNTVDKDNALNAISTAASKAKASTPTFQEKTLNFLGDAASKFNPYMSSNVYNSVVAPSLAKSSGVNLASGSDLYNDAKILADPTSFTQSQVDNVYKKYGLLN